MLEQHLKSFAASDPRCRRLMTVPGIGWLIASALVCVAGDIHDFTKARDFSAFLGLVPRQRSTGGKTRLLGLSKCGNRYLQMFLIHGARSVLWHSKPSDHALGAFLSRLTGRGLHKNKVAAAGANKIARLAWVVLSRNECFRPQPTGG